MTRRSKQGQLGAGSGYLKKAGGVGNQETLSGRKNQPELAKEGWAA